MELWQGLSELQGKYNGKGFEVFAFPCNQFGKQEPAPAPEVKKFAEGRGFKGPVFGKVEVNGANGALIPRQLNMQDVLGSIRGVLLQAYGHISEAKYMGLGLTRFPATQSPLNWRRYSLHVREDSGKA